jgi:hypothetical protein
MSPLFALTAATTQDNLDRIRRDNLFGKPSRSRLEDILALPHSIPFTRTAVDARRAGAASRSDSRGSDLRSAFCARSATRVPALIARLQGLIGVQAQVREYPWILRDDERDSPIAAGRRREFPGRRRDREAIGTARRG